MFNIINSGGKLPYAKFLQRINGLKTFWNGDIYLPLFMMLSCQSIPDSLEVERDSF